jgi:hypothetical protein
MAVGAAAAAAMLTPMLAPLEIAGLPLPWILPGLWAAYGWACAGPSALSWGLLFLLGLWHDLLSGGPWGGWALVYFAAHGAALLQRELAPALAQSAILPLIAPGAAMLAMGAALSALYSGQLTIAWDFAASVLATAILSIFAARLYLFEDADEGEA